MQCVPYFVTIGFVISVVLTTFFLQTWLIVTLHKRSNRQEQPQQIQLPEVTGISRERDQIYIWVRSVVNGEMRQFRIDRVVSLTEAETGKIIHGVDLARWLSSR